MTPEQIIEALMQIKEAAHEMAVTKLVEDLLEAIHEALTATPE